MESKRERNAHRGSGGPSEGLGNGFLAKLKLGLILLGEWVLRVLDQDRILRTTALLSNREARERRECMQENPWSRPRDVTPQFCLCLTDYISVTWLPLTQTQLGMVV